VTSSVSLPAASSAAADRGRRSWVRSAAPALVMVGYLAAAVVVTGRLWADPASSMVAGNPNDTDLFAWMMRYSATAISHGRLPALVTPAMNAPMGINMMWNTGVLLPASLLTPVTEWLGPQVSLNVLLTIGFAGSAASMLAALRHWNVSLPAAAVGGAVYGFSPALVQSAIGHYNLQFMVLPPLIADVMLRMCLGRARPVRSGVLLGLLVAGQLFISSEILLTTVFATALILVVTWICRPRAVPGLLRPASVGVGVAVGTALLLTGRALWVQFAGPLTEHGSAFLFDFYKNDLLGFVTPSRMLLFHTTASAAAAARYQGGPPEYLAYLGAPLILVLAVTAIAGWRQLRVRALAVCLVVLVLLSLGAHPLIDGTVQQGVTLPWGWIGQWPLVGAVLPDRLSLVTDGLAAALTAFAVDMAWSALARSAAGWGRMLTATVAAVTVLAVVPLVPLPLPAASTAGLPAGWDAAFAALRLPPGARVLTVPVPTATLTDALRWQADNGAQISLNGGYFQGPASNGHAYVEGNGLPPLASYLDSLWTGSQPGTPPTAAQARATLAAWDPAAVVAVAGTQPALARYLRTILGRPSFTRGSVLVWRMRG
jgi:hypothetical protein